MNQPTYEEVLNALKLMVEHHCTMKDGTLFHFFINANEEAFEVLERAGVLRKVGNESHVFVDGEEPTAVA